MGIETQLRAAGPLRIAIVEDEAIVALQVEAHLIEAGHEVVGIADTLGEAVRLVDEARPDIALVDIQLAEGSSGLDVASALNKRGIICVFTTGNCPGDGSGEAIGCLHKPYNQIQLLGAVNVASAVAQGQIPDRVPADMHLFR